MPESSKNGIQPHHTKYDVFRASTSQLCKKLRAQEIHKTSLNHLFSVVFNFLAVLQLILGATITALGPLAHNHMVAITVLGAVNTVVAGVLALMKGRGLPQRLRKDLAEIRNVMTYIEEVEIKLKYGGDGDGTGEQSNKDVTSLIKDVFNRYKVMQDVLDMNQPDSYVNAPQLERASRSGTLRPVDEEMGIPAR